MDQPASSLATQAVSSRCAYHGLHDDSWHRGNTCYNRRAADLRRPQQAVVVTNLDVCQQVLPRDDMSPVRSHADEKKTGWLTNTAFGRMWEDFGDLNLFFVPFSVVGGMLGTDRTYVMFAIALSEAS